MAAYRLEAAATVSGGPSASTRISLHRLVTGLRPYAGVAGLVAEAHGDVGRRLQLTVSALSALGVQLSLQPPRAGLEHLGLGFITLRAREPGPGSAGHLPVLLVIARHAPLGLLLPAVQTVREAGRRLALEPGSLVYVGAGGGAPGPEGPGSTLHAGWFRLRDFQPAE